MLFKAKMDLKVANSTMPSKKPWNAEYVVT